MKRPILSWRVNFSKKICDNTFSGSDNEDANEHIEKVLEIVDLFHIPEVTQDQIMLRVFAMSLTGVARRWLRNEPVGSIDTWEALKKKFLIKYCPPARTKAVKIAIPPGIGLDVHTRQILDSKGVIPSIKAADAKKAIQDMADYSQTWHNGTSNRTRSTETFDGLAAIQAQMNNLGRQIKKVNERVVPFPQGGRYRAVAPGFYQRDNGNPSYQERRQTMEESLSKFMKSRSLDQSFGDSNRQMSKVLQKRGSRSLPSSIKMNPRDHVKSILTVVEADTPLIRQKERLSELMDREKSATNLKKLLMEKPKIGSLDPVYGDYIEVNDLNGPLELRRDQVEDLGPTIEDVMENMDAYRDDEMGDVIFGKLFCREVYVKARRFDGMITIYNGSDSVTYQMARSYPRFKHLTNAQCNKMRLLLKVSAHDKLNGISHSYQKLKGFYKGVLNLGPEYVKDAKIEELLTRRHVSIHEME
ncbi:homeodomain-like protein [Tanacetum coccineum]